MDQFMLMVREWKHIKIVKRGGRAFDPGGICATAPGSLAIPCRACPLPNINLPRGWENVPPERAWVFLHRIILCHGSDSSLDGYTCSLSPWTPTFDYKAASVYPHSSIRPSRLAGHISSTIRLMPTSLKRSEE